MAADIPLPNELLVVIFKHLDGGSLRTLSRVNRRFAHVLQQERLLYRHGVFSSFGLRFPGALKPTPFLALPELGITPVSPLNGRKVFEEIQRLEVRPHSPDKCVMFDLMWPRGTAHTSAQAVIYDEGAWCLPVLCIELLTPDPTAPSPQAQGRQVEGGLSTLLHVVTDEVNDKDLPTHRALKYSDSPPASRDDGTYWSDMVGCRYIDHFIVNEPSVMIDKIVVRNAPAVLYHQSPSTLLLPRYFFAAEQCVLVINSAGLWKDKPRACCVGPLPDLPHSVFGLGPQPRGTPEIVIVFWTGDPEARWVPPCSHFSDPTQAIDSLFHKCSAMDKIWEGMKTTIDSVPPRYACKVTLVNTDAIMSLATPQTHSMSLVEAYLRSRFPSMFNAAISGYPPPVFRTMQEWIEDGHADDVFTPEELAPFKAKVPGV